MNPMNTHHKYCIFSTTYNLWYITAPPIDLISIMPLTATGVT